jgi:hypothetical protein
MGASPSGKKGSLTSVNASCHICARWIQAWAGSRRPGRYERGGRDGEGGGENTTAPGSGWPDGQGTVRLGMLATAVVVGRMTADSGGRAKDGQGPGPAGRRGRLRRGWARPPATADRPTTRPTRRPSSTAATAARPTPPRRSRPRVGWTSPSGPPRRSRPTRCRCCRPGWPSTPCWPCSRRSSPGSRSMGWSPTRPRSATRSPT